MRIRPAMSIGLLLLTLGVPATRAAASEIYLSGGVSANNLRGDAGLFGIAIATELANDPGGVWTSDKKGRVGVDLGAGFSFPLTPVLDGAVELRYVTRGAKYEFVEISGSGISATGTWKLNYVELPLLLMVKPPVSGTVRPVILFGPVVAFKASSDFEIESGGQSGSVPIDDFKSTAFAGLLGAGIRVSGSPRSNFDLQARYQLGFTNLFNTSSPDFKSSGFSFLAGWSWSLRASE